MTMREFLNGLGVVQFNAVWYRLSHADPSHPIQLWFRFSGGFQQVDIYVLTKADTIPCNNKLLLLEKADQEKVRQLSIQLGFWVKARYRYLEAGEVIHEDDEADVCTNPMKDPPSWVRTRMAGYAAPDPAYPANTRYRRRINQENSNA